MESGSINASNGASKFIKGTAILGLSAIIVKILGAVFRIPLGNILGDEGMGYYQTAYPIYNIILVISTAGIPTAIAKLVSAKLAMGDVKGADRVFSTTIKLMAAFGVVLSLFVISGAFPLVKYINNEKAVYSILAIAPAIFFISLTECFRGYFQGIQKMEAFAFSQITEQFVRVVIGLGLALALLKFGTDKAAAGATFGATLGCIAGLVVIFVFYGKFKRKKEAAFPEFGDHERESTASLIKSIVMIAIPVTLGASILPAMTIVDLGLVFNRLSDAGFSHEQANALYGQLTGFALTIVNLPQALTAAIQISTVPAVSHYYAIKDKLNVNHTVETALRLGLILGLPMSMGISLLSVDVMKLLYPMQLSIAESTGKILFILGFSIVFLALYQVTTGSLQGIGKQNIPAYNLLIALVVKIVLTYVTVGNPDIGINGAAWSTVTALATASILNIVFLLKNVDMKLSFSKVFMKPAISTLVMGIAVKGSHILLTGHVKPSIVTVMSIFAGIFVYGFMLIATKTLTKDDLSLMPGGSRLEKIIKK